ncbi:hypothetical protein Mal64_37550 [Pseudobythopirellula maris]|uniref:DUF4440 domain-containing protein n=1 Tax=Pseudobythopirellula maris TaxID=2527991 RepID=A0A5C5ZII1_9BACT|nr:hypothetical protein [Pseudobythopirellula maris]TWT86925.1 hypothetical protein Mal64_37550 [Pseudobythopirellula maris]
MRLLLESPVPSIAVGAMLVTMAAIVYSQTRRQIALLAIAGAVLLTLLACVGERLWVTPREEVTAALSGLMADIEANDLTAVLAHIDPAAVDIVSDASTLMPQFAVEAAGVGSGPEITLDDESAPTVATLGFKPVIRARHKSSGATGAYFDGITMRFELRGGRWLLTQYEAERELHGAASQLGRP